MTTSVTGPAWLWAAGIAALFLCVFIALAVAAESCRAQRGKTTRPPAPGRANRMDERPVPGPAPGAAAPTPPSYTPEQPAPRPRRCPVTRMAEYEVCGCCWVWFPITRRWVHGVTCSTEHDTRLDDEIRELLQ